MPRRIHALVLVTLAAIAAARAHAAGQGIGISVTARALQPGELVVVTLDAPAAARGLHVAAFGRHATAFRSGGRWIALVGLDIDQRPGTFAVQADGRLGTASLHGEEMVTILEKRFGTRTLTVPSEFVNPPPAALKRIAADNALLQKAYSASASHPLWQGPFLRPVSEPANSRFGTRSVFNGAPRSPHSGTDFLSPAGTPVKAPNAGQVVVARDLFFSGNTVIIDHGLYVFSMLAHLSEMKVQEGQSIAAGDIVGLVGATGRVTGPHLHWALRVGGARVDGLSILAVPECCPLSDQP
jgi:murein DD-endopeptidase MepM/ murein hydrolase activator NlpD